MASNQGRRRHPSTIFRKCSASTLIFSFHHEKTSSAVSLGKSSSNVTIALFRNTGGKQERERRRERKKRTRKQKKSNENMQREESKTRQYQKAIGSDRSIVLVHTRNPYTLLCVLRMYIQLIITKTYSINTQMLHTALQKKKYDV